MGRQSKYAEEFRRKAAALVFDSARSIRDVGRELGVNHETLRGWVQALRRERHEGPAAVTADERLERAPGAGSAAAAGGRVGVGERRSCEEPLDHLRRELVLDAVGTALHQRRPAAGLLHHGDRGTQGSTRRSTSGAPCALERARLDGQCRRRRRQRHGRKLLRHGEGGAGLPPGLADPARAGDGGLQRRSGRVRTFPHLGSSRGGSSVIAPGRLSVDDTQRRLVRLPTAASGRSGTTSIGLGPCATRRRRRRP